MIFGLWLIPGIPPPTVDIFNILRSPTLYNKSLYEDNSDNENQKNDLDAFCQAMGWTNLDGVLPKKPEKKSKRHSRFEEIDLSDVHKDLAKTDVDKEMRTNTLKGIEKRREIKILREREALRERKVGNYFIIIYVCICSRFSTVIFYS